MIARRIFGQRDLALKPQPVINNGVVKRPHLPAEVGHQDCPHLLHIEDVQDGPVGGAFRPLPLQGAGEPDLECGGVEDLDGTGGGTHPHHVPHGTHAGDLVARTVPIKVL